MKSLLVLLCLWCIGGVFADANYCDPKLCPHNAKHVACTTDTGFASACGAGATQLNLKGALQQLIVDRHNMRRSQVATGNLTGFPQASQMLEMSWDDNLAFVAGFNARQCVMKHDACRNTPAYPDSGQNLASSGSSGKFQDPSATIINMIDNMWFAESKSCPPQLVNKFGPTTGDVGHFTAMIQQKSGKVGCAVTQYKSGIWYQTLMACNYQYTNMVGEAIYATGTHCSKCSGKCSTKNPGLCA